MTHDNITDPAMAVQILEGIAEVIERMAFFAPDANPFDRARVVQDIRDTAAAAADALDVDLAGSRLFGEEWVRAIWRSLVGDLIEPMYEQDLQRDAGQVIATRLVLQ